MQKLFYYILLILLFNSIFISLTGQDRSLPPNVYVRSEGFGYLLFTGQDAGELRTSIKGFGSGVLDYWNNRVSLEAVVVRKGPISISVGLGQWVNKYRFTDNIVISKDAEGIVDFSSDDDPSHDYVNTFFGYGKSKLITSSFYLPVNVNFMFAETWQLTTGVFADWMVFSKYKMKYLQEGEKQKTLIKSKEMMDYPWHKIKFGVHAGIMNWKWKRGISATWYLTPTFQQNMGPDVHEFRITFAYIMEDINEILHGDDK